MVYTRLENRKAYYNRLFGDGRLDRVGYFEKEGKIRAFDVEGKKLGPDIVYGKDAHRLLAKLYPDRFTTPEGYGRSTKQNSRLVATRKRNVAREMKAADFKDLGMTKKDAYRLSKVMKKNGLPTDEPEQMKKLMQIYKRGQKEKITRFALTNYKKFWVSQVGQERSKKYKLSDVSWGFRPKLTYKNIHHYVENLRPYLQEKLLEFKKNNYHNLKFQYNQWVRFELAGWDDELERWVIEKTTRSFFRGTVQVVLNDSQINAGLSQAFSYTMELINKYTMQGSGWRVQKIEEAYLNIFKYEAIKGGKFRKTLPKWVLDKTACLTIPNEDNRCFFYCLLAALHPDQINTKHLDRLDGQFEPLFELHPEFDEKDLPMQLSGISKYEDLIQKNIHVLALNKATKQVITLRLSGNDYEDTICLLHYKNHYFLVTNISRLISKQAKQRNLRNFLCMRCLNFQTTIAAHKQHLEMCKRHDTCRVSMPSKDELMFDSYSKKLTQPFMISCDFEALPKEDGTHKPCGAHYSIISRLYKDEYGEVHWLSKGKKIRDFFDRSPECVRKFLDSLKKIAGSYILNLCTTRKIWFLQ